MAKNLDLQAIQQALDEERRMLLERIHAEEEKLRSSAGVNSDQFDLAQEYAARERRSVRLAQAREQLEHIEAALHRLEAGRYGQCTQCGEAIASERLKVLPYAALCVRCQERLERSAPMTRLPAP
jgi:RNA polymerase-binding protein DksA